jgi:hypothetical protein
LILIRFISVFSKVDFFYLGEPLLRSVGLSAPSPSRISGFALMHFGGSASIPLATKKAAVRLLFFYTHSK